MDARIRPLEPAVDGADSPETDASAEREAPSPSNPDPLQPIGDERRGYRFRKADGPYQMFDPLLDDEYQALKADIAKNGMINPIIEDENGTVVAGHHRKRAWEELRDEGKVNDDYPKVVKGGLSDDEKIELALRDGLLRRNLGPVARGRVLLKICERRGVRFGAGARNDLTGPTVGQVLKEYGVPRATGMYWLQLARDGGDRFASDRIDSATESTTEATKRTRRRADLEKWLNGDSNPWDEWQGMPEFVQEDLEPKFQLVLKFRTRDDLDEFSGKAVAAGLIDRPLREREPNGIWYPPEPIGHYKDFHYIDASSGLHDAAVEREQSEKDVGG